MNNNTHQYSVSVVIATLGGETLNKTIEFINSGTIVPNEILVCIPEEYLRRVDKLCFTNVNIIATKCKGQVAQRVEGFKHVKSEYVMQIDDDCILGENTMETLIGFINSFSYEIAIAPKFVNESSGQSFYLRSKPKIYEQIFSYILNGTKTIKPGTITKAGVNLGVCFTNTKETIIETEWLAGGCVMFKKQSLILDNYFPFMGKAYCEDLIHSFYLKRNGVRLYVTSNCFCRTELDPLKRNIKEIFKETLKEHKARKYLITISGRNQIRANVFFVLNLIHKSFKVLFKNNNI